MAANRVLRLLNILRGPPGRVLQEQQPPGREILRPQCLHGIQGLHDLLGLKNLLARRRQLFYPVEGRYRHVCGRGVHGGRPLLHRAIHGLFEGSHQLCLLLAFEKLETKAEEEGRRLAIGLII